MVAPPPEEASKDELRELVMKLIDVTNAQARRIEELEAKLKKDSGNSSKPPSSDAPWSKRRRGRRPASGKKQGGQPGHEGASRDLFDTSAVDGVEDHHATACPSCGGNDLEPIARPPVRHQVVDVPLLPAKVTEHRRHRGRCAVRGKLASAMTLTSRVLSENCTARGRRPSHVAVASPLRKQSSLVVDRGPEADADQTTIRRAGGTATGPQGSVGGAADRAKSAPRRRRGAP